MTLYAIQIEWCADAFSDKQTTVLRKLHTTPPVNKEEIACEWKDRMNEKLRKEGFIQIESINKITVLDFELTD